MSRTTDRDRDELTKLHELQRSVEVAIEAWTDLSTAQRVKVCNDLHRACVLLGSQVIDGAYLVDGSSL